MIDVGATNEAYNHMDIDDIVWIRSDENIADAFTKQEPNKVFSAYCYELVSLH